MHGGVMHTAALGALERDRRVELLAAADADELTELADALLRRLGAPSVVIGPETGLVMMQVREPVRRERFHLGEVVVSRAEVEWNGSTGWSMRLGTDRGAALSAALCDAGAEIDVSAADDVARLCARTEARATAAGAAEWHALSATVVSFEELD